MLKFDVVQLILPKERFPEYPFIRWSEPHIKFWRPWGTSIGYHYDVYLENTEKLGLVIPPDDKYPNYLRYYESLPLHVSVRADDSFTWGIKNLYPFKHFDNLLDVIEWWVNLDYKITYCT